MRLGVKSSALLSGCLLVVTLLSIHWSSSHKGSKAAHSATMRNHEYTDTGVIENKAGMDDPLRGRHIPRGPASDADIASAQRQGVNSSQHEVPGMVGVGIVSLTYPSDRKSFGMQDSTAENIKQEILVNMIAPNIVFMWCGGTERWFEFKHYISIRSSARSLKSDKITLFYQTSEPKIDKMYYNLWYEDLKHDLPFFTAKPMEDWQKVYCARSSSLEKLSVILQTLNYEGGLFISENTWMLEVSSSRRQVDLEQGFDMDQQEGYVLMRRGLLTPNTSVEHLASFPSDRRRKTHCSEVQHVYVSAQLGPCVVVRGGRYERIWPMDIWELDDAFGRLARRFFYGTEEIRKPQPSYDSLVPNIGHMVWIGGGRMDFVFYLSVLSMLYVAGVETVYIHGDVEPAGEYWPQIKADPATGPRVVFVERAPPYEIYQGEIEPWYRALMSDIIRVDLMIKYGGIYTDTDAIWSKPLSLEDRAYDAVASYDWVDWSWPYPDSVNFGISYGKKNAPFWQIFRDSMRSLHNDHHGFTGVMMPYKLLEKYPHLLKIDRHLQVICYYSKCHPIWVNDYHNMTKDHTNMHTLDNWQQDMNAFHWTHPNPIELSNKTILLESTGIFADLGKFVLRKAGLL